MNRLLTPAAVLVTALVVAGCGSGASTSSSVSVPISTVVKQSPQELAADLVLHDRDLRNFKVVDTQPETARLQGPRKGNPMYAKGQALARRSWLAGQESVLENGRKFEVTSVVAVMRTPDAAAEWTNLLLSDDPGFTTKQLPVPMGAPTGSLYVTAVAHGLRFFVLSWPQGVASVGVALIMPRKTPTTPAVLKSTAQLLRIAAQAQDVRVARALEDWTLPSGATA